MDIKSERLAAALQRSGLSQIELCKKAGVTAGALSSYLSGRYHPKQRTLEKLAEALNVSVVYLMGFDEPSCDDQADSLFIDKYGRQVFDAAMTFASLDEVDRGRIFERMSMLLEDDKYKKGLSEEKVI